MPQPLEGYESPITAAPVSTRPVAVSSRFGVAKFRPASTEFVSASWRHRAKMFALFAMPASWRYRAKMFALFAMPASWRHRAKLFAVFAMPAVSVRSSVYCGTNQAHRSETTCEHYESCIHRLFACQPIKHSKAARVSVWLQLPLPVPRTPSAFRLRAR
jgi:hypothetical protein